MARCRTRDLATKRGEVTASIAARRCRRPPRRAAPRGKSGFNTRRGLFIRELQLLAQLVPHFHATPSGRALLRRFNAGEAGAAGDGIHLEIIAEVQKLAPPPPAV